MTATDLEARPHVAMAELDRIVHEPSRLSVLTALLDSEEPGVAETDYLFLLRMTGLGKGNLSTHLGKLEQVGLVRTERVFVRRKTRTLIRLTAQGREAVVGWYDRVEAIERAREVWRERHREEQRRGEYRLHYGANGSRATQRVSGGAT